VKIKKVIVRRKFNLRNYETIDIELEAQVEEGEIIQEVAKFLDHETKRFRKNLEE
jgi:hypothetical protein